MTAVEVCPICDIAGCRHIRERATRTAQLSAALQVPEVTALVEAATRLLREAELDGMETRAGWDCWMSLCHKSLAALKGPQT